MPLKCPTHRRVTLTLTFSDTIAKEGANEDSYHDVSRDP